MHDQECKGSAALVPKPPTQARNEKLALESLALSPTPSTDPSPPRNVRDLPPHTNSSMRFSRGNKKQGSGGEMLDPR